MATKTLGVLLRCRRDKRALYMSVPRGQLFHNLSMSVAYMEVQITALFLYSFISTREVNGVYSGLRLALNPGTQALHKYNLRYLTSIFPVSATLYTVWLRLTSVTSCYTGLTATSWIDDWSTGTASLSELAPSCSFKDV